MQYLGFLIFIIILFFLFPEVMFTILGIGIGIGLLIRLIVFISDEQREKKKQNELNNIKIQLMNSFLSGLAQYSKKSYQKIDNIENGKIYINSEIKEYCDKVSLDNEIKRTFGELQRLLVNITTQYVCWSITNRNVNNYYPIDSLDLKRDEIKNINDDLIIEDLFARLSLVKLSIGNKFIAFTPYFIFIIDSSNQIIKFIDWKDVKANKDGNIKIKERRTVKNVNPIGYSWKHERINGGPDLRYRNNPRWPIINYNILEIKTKSVKYWLIPDLFSCTAIDNKIKEYVSKILSVTNTYPSADSNNKPPKSVKENLPQKNKNEAGENFKIALAIKELKNVNLHLLMEEKIYYALNDYLVFKNNPVEKKIFQMVVSEGYYTKLFNTKTDSKEVDKLLKEIVIQFDKAHDFDFAKIENIILNIAIGLEKINNNRLECLGNSKKSKLVIDVQQTKTVKNKTDDIYSENNVRTIYQRMLPILANKLVLELSDIKPNSEFVNDLGIDSLDTIELIMEFEKEFQIMIDENNPKLKEIINVWDGANYLNSILTTSNII